MASGPSSDAGGVVWELLIARRKAIIVSVVVASDGLQSDQAKVVAAARAAASWARARRAMWTDAPLPIVPTFVEDLPAAVTAPAPAAPPAPILPKRTGPSAATRILGGLRAIAGPVLRWVPRLAIATALVWGAFAGYPYVVKMLPLPTKAPETAGKPGPARRNAPKGKGPAKLNVNSTPPGAQVLLDGKQRGITPTTLNDVAPGRHTVELKHQDGNVTRTVTVDAGDTAVIDEQIFAGWVAIYSPTEVTITEGGRALRLDDRSQVLLPPGWHDIRIVNRTLGHESVQRVEVKPGEVTRLNVMPPRSSLTVTASEPAEVFLDGTKVGDSPMNDFAIDLGTHEVLVKRGGAERRFTVTATATPTTINVDFSRP